MLGTMVSALRRELRGEAHVPLVGVWELVAARQAGASLPRRVPRACILFTPGGKFIALLAGAHDPGIASAFREAFPYSGAYRIVGEAWITTQQRTWSDLSAEGELVHLFDLDGERLLVRPARGEFEFARMK